MKKIKKSMPKVIHSQPERSLFLGPEGPPAIADLKGYGIDSIDPKTKAAFRRYDKLWAYVHGYMFHDLPYPGHVLTGVLYGNSIFQDIEPYDAPKIEGLIRRLNKAKEDALEHNPLYQWVLDRWDKVRAAWQVDKDMHTQSIREEKAKVEEKLAAVERERDAERSARIKAEAERDALLAKMAEYYQEKA